MAKKKGCLGCSFPVAIVIGIILLTVGVISLLGGALGKELFSNISLPAWLSVPSPEPELPASVIFHLFGFPITNTIITSWITILFLLMVFYFGTRNMKLIPSRYQTIVESVIGYLLGFCEDIAGVKYGRKFFAIVATIFLFVITNAWISLIPGIGTITIHTIEGHAELFRGVNTDINFPLALALISFVFVEYWGIKTLGLGYFKKFINIRRFVASIKLLFRGQFKSAISGLFYGAMDIFIGLLEALSEIMRIISFTFRLFGNMTGGEILLLMMLFLAPFLLALPFYGLELFVGFIQALIFSGLTLVFANIAITPAHSEEEH
ncbi:MAG: F0F1 ATP synthase subunit A [Dehalococcoidales bacterium]|nr:F0F1 ATP synthase subunit A [Dehalococcoidales bacterium]